MVRVCNVLGPAQLFFLMAALRQQRRQTREAACEDHLILAGANVSEERRAVTERLAKAGWNWASITWASDLLDEGAIRISTQIHSFCAPLRKRIGTGVIADEIWVCRAAGLAERVVMLAWPKARLVLCDDGLAAYIHREPTIGSLYRKPRALARHLLNSARRASYRVPVLRGPDSHYWPNRSFDRVFALLGNVPRPQHGTGTRVHIVDPSEALAVIQAVQDELRLAAVADDAPRRVLVLGQYFHQFGNMTWEDELAIYTDVCKRVAEMGYGVLWKEHPKAPKPFFPFLAAAVPGMESAGIDGHFAWPIEFFADRLGLEACICGTSTCLFTLRQIFGMKTYTYAADLVDRLKGADQDVARLAARHAEPFSRFLESHAGGTVEAHAR